MQQQPTDNNIARPQTIAKSDPNLLMIMNLVKNNVMSNINCHNIGRITYFDSETQTCTVELMQVKQFNGNYYNPAPITQVPLIILGAGGGHITMPNPVGTICLLLFLDRNIDSFLQTGERYVPETARMHDFTDCVALTTFTTLANPLQDYDENAISIFYGQVINTVKYDSFIKVFSNSIQLQSNQTPQEDSPEEITPADSQVSIEPNQVSILSSLGGQISVSDKLSLGNTNQNLASLLQAFLTACENIAVNPETGVILPSSKQAFTDLKAQFEELLQ